MTPGRRKVAGRLRFEFRTAMDVGPGQWRALDPVLVRTSGKGRHARPDKNRIERSVRGA
jgi:hypothetical protein